MNQTLPTDQFTAIDENPAPAGIRFFDFSSPDQKRLRAAISPSAKRRTRGTIVLLQGRNEAIEKYFETMSDLNDLGYAVATFDWRGQGGSARLLRNRRLGHVRKMANYVNDLEAFLQDIVLPDCRGPFALLAHSMGGLIALQASHRLVNVVERMVLCAPLIAFPDRGLSMRSLSVAARAAVLVGLGRVPVRPPFFRYFTGQKVARPLTSDPFRLSRNRALAIEAPQLFLGSPTISWFAEMTAAMLRLQDSDRIARLAVPTLFIAAGDDHVVSTAATERLAWRMRSGSSLTVAHARHEILQEADRYREAFLEAFEAFVGHSLPAGE